MPCASHGFKDTYGRMAWNKKAPTITSGCFNPSKAFLHPRSNRASYARSRNLQGFPLRYRFDAKAGSKTRAYDRKCFAPEFIKRHAARVGRLSKAIKDTDEACPNRDSSSLLADLTEDQEKPFARLGEGF